MHVEYNTFIYKIFVTGLTTVEAKNTSLVANVLSNGEWT